MADKKSTPVEALTHQDTRVHIPTEELRDLAAEDEKAAKVATARNLWVPAINNHGGFGRWAFVEISDPWDAERTLRASLRGAACPSV